MPYSNVHKATSGTLLRRIEAFLLLWIVSRRSPQGKQNTHNTLRGPLIEAQVTGFSPFMTIRAIQMRVACLVGSGPIRRSADPDVIEALLIRNLDNAKEH